MRKGFTLAELLIALAILGIIATFTIPKILQNQADSKKKAVFRESIAALYNVFLEGYRSGDMQPNDASVKAYMTSHLNGVKVCPNNENAEGCCTGMDYCTTSESAVVMHNGSVIYSMSHESPGSSNTISPIVDWNGAAGPNTEGDDYVMLLLVMDGAPLNGVSSGRMSYWPNAPTDGSSQTLYYEIFSNN